MFSSCLFWGGLKDFSYSNFYMLVVWSVFFWCSSDYYVSSKCTFFSGEDFNIFIFTYNYSDWQETLLNLNYLKWCKCTKYSYCNSKNLFIFVCVFELRRCYNCYQVTDNSKQHKGLVIVDQINKPYNLRIQFQIFLFQTWLDLDSILSLVQPYGFFLKSAPFFHYVERLCAYYTANTEKLYDVPIIETLKKVTIFTVLYCQ